MRTGRPEGWPASMVVAASAEAGRSTPAAIAAASAGRIARHYLRGCDSIARHMSSPRTIRPRRSCHSVPGSSERFIAKAAELPADQIFLDLEDSVAPDEKENARGQV